MVFMKSNLLLDLHNQNSKKATGILLGYSPFAEGMNRKLRTSFL